MHGETEEKMGAAYRIER